jgi:serine protease Do
VERLQPSVVNINCEGVVQRGMALYNEFFGRLYLEPKRVSSLGSGLIVSPEGHIVTNSHVIEMAENLRIRVTLSNGSVYAAKLLASDPDKDLSLIKIDGEKPFPAFDLRELSPNLLGQTVIALGNPVGYQNSVTHGILSAKNRTLRSDGQTMSGLLQTDAAINPGNSGGPLLDINGKLVGLNSAKFAGAAIEGIGFAIPGEIVAAWAQDAIAVAKGLKAPPKQVSLAEVVRARFGMSLQTLTPELADSLGYRVEGGLLIAEVEKGSPAARAGLERGMIVVGVGTYPTLNTESMPRDLVRIKSGQRVRFTIVVMERTTGFVRQRGYSVLLTAR